MLQYPLVETIRIASTTEFEKLPPNAQAYVRFLSEQVGVEIGLISTGPERDQTIILKESVMEGWFN